MNSDHDIEQQHSRLGGREEPFEEGAEGPGRHGDKPAPGTGPDAGRHDDVERPEDADDGMAIEADVDVDSRPHRNV